MQNPLPPLAYAPEHMDVAGRYLDLVKQALTRSLFLDDGVRDIRPRGLSVGGVIDRAVRRRGYRIVTPAADDLRADGRDWPPTAETMIGLRRLDNIQHCVETVLADGIPGDVIEAGVWRGGATIFMRAVLAAHEITDRTVWVADSFIGHPPPVPERYPADEGDRLWTYGVLAVNIATNGVACALNSPSVVPIENGVVTVKLTLPLDMPIGSFGVVMAQTWGGDIRVGMPGPCTELIRLSVHPKPSP